MKQNLLPAKRHRKALAAIALSLLTLMPHALALATALTPPRLTGGEISVPSSDEATTAPAVSAQITPQQAAYTEVWQAHPATLNQRMSTRTGPSTLYTEDHGTLPQTTQIVLYQQEAPDEVAWGMVEFERNGKLIRAYTGMKRIDANAMIVPWAPEKPQKATIIKGNATYFGPGTEYLQLETGVMEGLSVLVYGEDRGYVLIDYEVSGGKRMRSWVPSHVVGY